MHTATTNTSSRAGQGVEAMGLDLRGAHIGMLAVARQPDSHLVCSRLGSQRVSLSTCADHSARDMPNAAANECVACRDADTAAFKMIDGDLLTFGSTGFGVDPWFRLTTSARMNNIRAVSLLPRQDQRWAQLNNVTVTISSSSELGAPGSMVCATNIYATEASDEPIVVQCPTVSSFVINTIFVQRFSNGAAVEFGLAEVKILRARECPAVS